jgi:cellulose synthase operon protein C
MSKDLAGLRTKLLASNHKGRIDEMLELGRRARTDARALAMIDALSGGEVFERRMALLALQTLEDGARLLPFTRDVSRSVRTLAFTMVPRIASDDQALEALQVAYALRRDPDLLRELSRRDRRGVVDRHLDWLSERPGLHDFADFVPLASLEGVRRHLDRALERPSAKFWKRMARNAAGPLGLILCDRLRDVPGEPDPVTRQLIEAHTAEIAERAPDEALELLDLLLARGIRSQLTTLRVLGSSRPSSTLELIERHDLRITDAVFRKSAPAFSPAELSRITRRDPALLGHAEDRIEDLSAEQLEAVVLAWCEVAEQHPVWGFALLEKISDRTKRIAAHERWSVAARDANGVVPIFSVEKLPSDLRELEARRHLDQVIALHTRPEARIPFAKFLPWSEAEAYLKAYIGHPEGGMRGIALSVLLAIPGLRPEETALADKALQMILARKNEQDPVRDTMLRALIRWPRAVWRKEHTSAVGQIIRDALDAGDLSHGTAQAAESLLVRVFRLDPAWAAGWLATFIKERGTIYDARIGAHLSDDEVRAAARELLEIAKSWCKHERLPHLIQLAESLGDRLGLVRGLSAVVAKACADTQWSGYALSCAMILARFDRPLFESELGSMLRRWIDKGWQGAVLQLAARPEKPGRRQPPLHKELADAVEKIARGHGRDGEVLQAVTILRTRALVRFDEILGDLLKKDESYVCLGVVHWHLHKRRQDLLGPFLGDRVIRGRFATGNTAWILPFADGFHRWTPDQNAIFARSLATVVKDKDRDTPTVWRCLTVLAAMDSAPMDDLASLAADARPAVQERAIRVMARCDQGQCVPTLLDCLGDARARIAIYGFRRAVKDLLPKRALAILESVPMSKVTVAKEIVRLLGELRDDAAYRRLVVLDGTKLHRDVRIALLRALWDHMDRVETWRVFESAVTGSDWVMASRLGDIPADRLTKETDRKLSSLLARVLKRPEPEARIDLLGRAAFLAVRDPERAFLSACSARLRSIYDDEVRAAMNAILHRSTEDDLERLPELLSVALDDPRALHVAIGTLASMPVKSRASWVGAAHAAEKVLARDPRWIVLRVRTAALAMNGAELAAWISTIAEAGLLAGDALFACGEAIGRLPFAELEGVVDRLRSSKSPEARRAAVWALVRDAGPDRGWSPERLERLAALKADPSPLVSGAAHAVFPPREMEHPPVS